MNAHTYLNILSSNFPFSNSPLKAIKRSALILATSMIYACGGGSAGTPNNPPPQNTNNIPVITSVDQLSVAESSDWTHTITATDSDGDTIRFSISGGDDRAVFQINPVSGELSSIANFDYESPQDQNADNSYQVIIDASDQNTGIARQTVTVDVSGSRLTPVALLPIPNSNLLGMAETVRIRGKLTASDGVLENHQASVTVNDVDVTFDSDDNSFWYADIPLTVGDNTVEVVLIDSDGGGDDILVYSLDNTASIQRIKAAANATPGAEPQAMFFLDVAQQAILRREFVDNETAVISSKAQGVGLLFGDFLYRDATEMLFDEVNNQLVFMLILPGDRGFGSYNGLMAVDVETGDREVIYSSSNGVSTTPSLRSITLDTENNRLLFLDAGRVVAFNFDDASVTSFADFSTDASASNLRCCVFDLDIVYRGDNILYIVGESFLALSESPEVYSFNIETGEAVNLLNGNALADEAITWDIIDIGFSESGDEFAVYNSVPPSVGPAQIFVVDVNSGDFVFTQNTTMFSTVSFFHSDEVDDQVFLLGIGSDEFVRVEASGITPVAQSTSTNEWRNLHLDTEQQVLHVFNANEKSVDSISLRDSEHSPGAEFVMPEGLLYNEPFATAIDKQNGTYFHAPSRVFSSGGISATNIRTGASELIYSLSQFWQDKNLEADIFFVDSMAFDEVSGRLLVGISWTISFSNEERRELFWINADGTDRTTVLSTPSIGFVSQSFFNLFIDSENDRVLSLSLFGSGLEMIDLNAGGEATLSSVTLVGGRSDTLIGLHLASSGERALTLDIANSELLWIDVVTGERSVLSDADTGNGPLMNGLRDVVLDEASGRAFVSSPSQNVIFVVDLETGDRSVLNP
ncbi:MAG: hypothetical protein COA42_15785 [Alteromonadaceae bacterium]|nr:MAG: hypothetical protein COA42_15785 [Alteromonadaceae bacterium]